ncbi:MAG: lipopolysaccharide biosynthesis protein [Muribaculaceae bacterium]|nr:lipopolysaccharide biosynthesis protein [Muribaculaceae bacterium]
MLVSITVNLYTVRLLWNVLGIDNYGIYNVVGGVVMMFAFLNSAMIQSSQRFIAYEIGGGNMDRLKRTFSITLTVHFIIAIVIFVLSESIGLWFLNSKLNIPEGRMYAANWVYQCSIISFLITIISVPYNACIVAHEHMKIYGYFGILEVILKLIIVLIVAVLPFDKLIAYAILLVGVTLIMRLIYGIYCSRHFEECHVRKVKDPILMKQMFSFAGWSFIGNMGFIVRDQGINIILNLFFDVAVNAAKSLASQVGNVINGFFHSFLMALNPQITKNYASGNLEEMKILMFQGCKYSLLLISMIAIPLIICAEAVLKLWLGDIAPYTVGFLQLTLILSFVDCVITPITTAIQATGKVKIFQIIISIIMISNLPLAWIALKLYLNPYIVLLISIITAMIALMARLIILHGLVYFSYRKFFSIVYKRSIIVIILSSLFSYYLYMICSPNIWGLIGFGSLSVIMYLILAFFIALTNNEKRKVLDMLKNRLAH